MIGQCMIIFLCLALGEAVVRLTKTSVPSSIIGMILLTIFLQFKIVKLQWVKGLSDFLLKNLGFFFVPSGVALMLYFEVIKAEILPIAVATILSTAVVIVATGFTHQMLKKRGNFK